MWPGARYDEVPHYHPDYSPFTHKKDQTQTVCALTPSNWSKSNRGGFLMYFSQKIKLDAIIEYQNGVP
ncbi:hypothetical protein, partial [Periweissella ghanensis]|uniref:hypothetical protein n=1 Tax=Periweissella ghanensis TaxID=467997 RepID=UPI001E5FC67C